MKNIETLCNMRSALDYSELDVMRQVIYYVFMLIFLLINLGLCRFELRWLISIGHHLEKVAYKNCTVLYVCIIYIWVQ